MRDRLTLFGPPAITLPAGSFVLPFERRSQLLAYLAFKRDWVGRAELAALLWPGIDSRLAFTNLRKALHRLPLAAWAPPLESRPTSLRLQIDTDVADFQSALRESRVRDALGLWQGELLARFDDDDNTAWSEWLTYERGRLRAAWREAALEELADDIEPASAIELTTRLLEADPLDEAALSAQLNWLARGGQFALARQRYREFSERLQHDLGISPSADLVAMRERLDSASATQTVALAPGTPANEGFVGRSVELRQIRELLAQPACRMLCLMGPGGVGKTWLARRALRECSTHYPDGTAMIPLEDLASIDKMGARLARELGVPLAGSRDPLEQVIAALGARRMLLVLDNFEQLVAGATVVEQLLEACPGIDCIVTSRVRLGLAMEWLFRVEGLPCPEPEDIDHVETFDAARLFIEMAQRVEPKLVPEAEAAAIVEICALVDGLPLALGLAAGWTRLLSCEAIAAEIRHGVDLLRAADATQPPRHASIEAVFEQSWRLLSPAEREALMRLAVFRGGCSLPAARAVADASLPVLAALADKSLLRKDGARFSLHPLVQQMAELRLNECEPESVTRKAHANHFLRLLQAERHGTSRGNRDALHRVDVDFENCRAAWRWATQHGARDLLIGSAAALSAFTDHQCRFAEGLELLREALASPAISADRAAQAVLQGYAAHLQYRLEEHAEAEANATLALTAAKTHDQPEVVLQCLRVLGTVNMRRGRYADAKRHFSEALRLAPVDVDPQNAADMLNNLAAVASTVGDFDEALRLAAESTTLHRQIGDVAGEASGLSIMALTHMSRGEFEAAGLRLNAGLAIAEQHGLVTLRIGLLGAMVDQARKTGDFDAAERHATRTLALAEAAGYRALMSGLKFDFVHIALHRGDFAAARRALGEGVQIAIAIGRPALQLTALTWSAEILAAQGEVACACKVMALVMAHPLTNAADRKSQGERLAQWHDPASPPPDASRLDFDSLVHRVAAEAEVAYAPLIAALKAT